ncbi:oxidoreductase [Synechococcales cyanobacterium C]|uniref:Oxidoreductase n=1 Tax=Petrachloros mirabilis ULC683 TaxID=2781853 RepID=A0A8K1ZZH5_9CYAN|nr:ferric reductase-like transmembrane domain-containing protein [Petrachloros mirabilis]NCJ07683.1 oxidoreductase [Petrachloros mirabilis ULC683]
MKSLLTHSPIAIALFWISAYLVLTVAPLFLLLLYPPTASDRSFWTEFSVALGFIGLAMMALQFALTARINRIEASYGVDIILQFHRFISIVAVIFIVIHPILLFIDQPETLQLLNFPQAPWRAQAAMGSTLALLLLIATAIWRQPLKIPYEPWRTSHGILATLALALGVTHAIGVGYYLSLFWKAVLWAGIALTALWLLVYVRVIKPWMMLKKPYLVESVTAERGEVWTLTLHPRGHDGLQFQPGQFAWITLDISPFQMREHPFSMSSSAENTNRLAFSIKALGDFTRTIKEVKPGTKAYLDGPYGVFTTDRYEDTSGFVLIAGGIGITPMISILRTEADRDDERPHLLIYASRSWEDITFREKLEELESRLNLKVVHVLRHPPQGWIGETGYVDKALLGKYIPKRRATRQYFICAAPRMMDQVEADLHALGVPVTHVHMEHFNMV